MNNSTAIILAGGKGQRLRSEVTDVPAVLAPVGHAPFLAYLLHLLASKGITDAILAVGYKGQLVEEIFQDEYAGIRLQYSYEPTPLGTGGALVQALDRYNSSRSVWLVNGNSYFDADYAAIEQLHNEESADATLALTHVENTADQLVMRPGLENLIDGVEDGQQGRSGIVFTGVSLINPESLMRFDYEKSFSLIQDMFDRYLMDLRLFGLELPGTFLRVNTPPEYARAQRVLLDPELVIS